MITIFAQLKKKLEVVPKYFWILLLIVLVGTFLRTYNFHDWLRFNADQSRDATLASRVVAGQDAWPVLGPKAGGTNFKLGPMFYDFQIIAGKVFGSAPDKVAYPDLFFSLLSIPLLFFLMRKYFSPNISLVSTAVYSFSYYAIRYSRFAWNPNSAPFWTMLFLYALLEIFTPETKNPFDKLKVKKFMWAIGAGVAVGVGMQLHTFLLVALPIVTILAFGYLAWKDKKILKYFLVIFVVAVVMNTTQLLNEIQTKGQNVKALIGGANTKQEKNSLFSKVLRNGSCFTVANTYMASSLGGSDSCELYAAKNGLKGLLLAIASLAFLLGGLGLAIWRVVSESNLERKRFLGLFLAYTGVLFLLFTPVAYEISMRYFLILLFMPFVFLGLWLEFLAEKLKSEKVILVMLTAFLISTNVVARADFVMLNGLAQGKNGSFDIVYLGELESVARYIVTNADNSKEALLDGNNVYLFKAAKSLIYLTDQMGTKLSQVNKKSVGAGRTIFYLTDTKTKENVAKGLQLNYQLLGEGISGRFTVLKLKSLN